jgi:glutathione S-transferase
MDHWITFSDNELVKDPSEKSFEYLNKALLNSSYLVSDRLTIADLAMFDKLSRMFKDLSIF